MRKEVKFGVIAGVILAALVVAYLVFANRNASPADNAAGNDLALTENKPINQPDWATSVPGSMPATTSAPAGEVVSNWSTSQPTNDATSPRLGVGQTATGAPATTTYVWKAHDTLPKIALEKLGDRTKVALILRANPGLDQAHLKPGQKILIPTVASAAGSTGGTETSNDSLSGAVTLPSAGAGAGETYIVQAGDAGLWAIAKKHYGDGSKYKLIEKANPGIKSSAIHPGQKIIIPPDPGASGASTGATSSSSTSRPARTEHPARKAPPGETSNRPVFD